MKEYKNLRGSSSVEAYEYGSNWITVLFTSGVTHTYTHENLGMFKVEAMKQCADNGHGLSSLIYDSSKGNGFFRLIMIKLFCDSDKRSSSCKWLVEHISWLKRYFVVASPEVLEKYPEMPSKKASIMNVQYSLTGTGGILGRHKLTNNSPVQHTKRVNISEKAEIASVLSHNHCALGKCLDDISGLKNKTCAASLLLKALKNMSETSVLPETQMQ